MTSWINKHLLSRKTVDHRAWFLCKLLPNSIDEATYQQVRHQLEQGSGLETRVRLTSEGWMSGSKKTSKQLPIEFFPIDSVEALTVDTVHFNVLICVVRCFGRTAQLSSVQSPASSDQHASVNNIPFQILAYKFENESLPRRYVECFNSIRRRSAGAPGERHSRKSKSSKNKKAAAASAAATADVASNDEEFSPESGRKQSLIPGRLAMATGKLAVEQWTVKDRATPKLFASASLDNLLESVDENKGTTKRRTAVKKRTEDSIVRSKSFEGGLDETGPEEVIMELNNNADVEDINEADDVVDDLDDLDEDAAAAGADFWRDSAANRDNIGPKGTISGYTLPPFRGTIVPADVVIRRPLAATVGTWSSMDNLDRRSIDNWSSGESSDASGAGRLETFSTRDVGITARFPAATDPKNRPERMDCVQLETASETRAIIGDGVADAQCQVDMPRLRRDMDYDNNSDARSTERNSLESGKIVFSDDDDDDDGWDFDIDDGQTSTVSTAAVVNEHRGIQPLAASTKVATVDTSFTSSNFSTAKESTSSAVPEMSFQIQRVFTKPVSPPSMTPDNNPSTRTTTPSAGSPSSYPTSNHAVTPRTSGVPAAPEMSPEFVNIQMPAASSSTKRNRLPSGAAFAPVSPVGKVGHHRRHHSDSGSAYANPKMRESHVFLSPQPKRSDGRHRARPQTFIYTSGSRSFSTASASVHSSGSHSASVRRPNSQTTYIQLPADRRHQMRSGSTSSTVSNVAMSSLPPPPPPPPPMPSSSPGKLTVTTGLPTQSIRHNPLGPASPPPLSPDLPSPPAFLQQRNSVSSRHRVSVHQNSRV